MDKSLWGVIFPHSCVMEVDDIRSIWVCKYLLERSKQVRS